MVKGLINMSISAEFIVRGWFTKGVSAWNGGLAVRRAWCKPDGSCEPTAHANSMVRAWGASGYGWESDTTSHWLLLHTPESYQGLS